ncbi:DegT/DnrJ/EryC1/StrS family aminotransferase [uncultured Methanolobus sp.]|uniref:DegT/DnrJ/EryC1/StrS family aminotransferase n=1 Tax=uncultured Methanolobus sp. TaxID=218300 RepID=UPI0029C931EB|nr:DegT/DnrJ/EryC1/StrS family aminotransferase [uncultured Methanolobus sp.]
MLSMAVSNYAGKLHTFSKLLVSPYKIGFVQPHSYLSDDQTKEIKSILESGSQKNLISIYENKMARSIGSGYGLSFAAGRMAFYVFLRSMGIGPGDEVILPGFTCSVMPNAILKVGAKPVFSDIDVNTFGSSADSIRENITPRTKAVVAQHSFGIPCKIEEIADLCSEHGLLLIEDSAISFGSTLKGTKVGNWGDAAIFSTDHSKPMNTIIGGFLYTRDYSVYLKARSIYDQMPELDNPHQKKIYEQFLFERVHYVPDKYPRAVLIGYMHDIAKRSGISHADSQSAFLENDYTKPDVSTITNVPSYPYPARMPGFLAKIGLLELKRWKYEKVRRKKILRFYIEKMGQMGLGKYVPKVYSNSAFDIIPLRFAFDHPDAHLIKMEMSKYIDVSWTWFCQPVICCPKGPEDLGYVSGSCQVGEKACDSIVNWPCSIPEGWETKIEEIFVKIMTGFK